MSSHSQHSSQVSKHSSHPVLSFCLTMGILAIGAVAGTYVLLSGKKNVESVH